MKFEKKTNGQIAQGKFGKFTIIKGSYGRYFGKYTAYDNSISFNFPAKYSIKELKNLMKENHYWYIEENL